MGKYQSLESKIRNIVNPTSPGPKDASLQESTEDRIKIQAVSRPDSKKPTSSESKLTKQAEILNKVVESEGDGTGARKVENPTKTKVELHPETNDNVNDNDEQERGRKNLFGAKRPPKASKTVLTKEDLDRLDNIAQERLAPYLAPVLVEDSGWKDRKSEYRKGSPADLSAEEKARLDAIAASFEEDVTAVGSTKKIGKKQPIQPTTTAAPSNDKYADKSGVNASNDSTDYTISDEVLQKTINLIWEQEYEPKHVKGLYSYNHYEAKDGSFIQIRHGSQFHATHQDKDGNSTKFDDAKEFAEHLKKIGAKKAAVKEDIQEGAALKIGGGPNNTHEDVVTQLRKVVHTRGAVPVMHLDGKSTKITPQLAKHALSIHDEKLKTPAEKKAFAGKLHASFDSMRQVLGG